MLYVGAVGFDVLAELLCDLCIALEQVFARHAGLAGRTARRDDVFRILECFCDIRGEGEVHIFEAAVEQLFGDAFEGRCERVVETDVRGEAHHHCGLRHVRTDHAGGAHDGQFFFGQEFHVGSVILIKRFVRLFPAAKIVTRRPPRLSEMVICDKARLYPCVLPVSGRPGRNHCPGHFPFTPGAAAGTMRTVNSPTAGTNSFSNSASSGPDSLRCIRP